MIEELLDKYSVDEFDKLLIEIIKRMKERKEVNAEELTIDINEYIQCDEDGENVIYFNEAEFVNDAQEYLQNDNPEYRIVEENS
jgi:hypothetical protein